MDETSVASEPQLAAFEHAFGAIPSEYRAFLSTTPHSAIRSIQLGGIRDLPHFQTKYQKEFGPPAGWSMENVFVIGWSPAGEPVAIHRRTGAVLVEHGPGNVHILAKSFRSYLEIRE